MFLNSAGDFGVDSDTLYVDASTDRVGIGTNSPAAPLSLVGVNGGNWNDGLIIDDPSGWSCRLYIRGITVLKCLQVFILVTTTTSGCQQGTVTLELP